MTHASNSSQDIYKMGPRRLSGLLVRSLRLEVSRRMMSVIGTVSPTIKQPKVAPLVTHENKASYDNLEPDSQDIGFLSECFDRVVVMTIPRNENERLSETRKQLASCNYEIYYGVDQLDFTADQLRLMLADLGSRAPEDASPAMMAHSIGFLRLMHNMVQNRIPRILFIEDDFTLAPYAKTVFAKARQEIESTPINGNWELIHFHSHLPCTPPDMLIPGGINSLYHPKLPDFPDPGGLPWEEWVAFIQRNPGQLQAFHEGRQYIENASSGFLQYTYRGYSELLSTLCVAISLEGAKKIIHRSAEWLPSDRLCGTVSCVKDHRVYIVSPFPCHPRPIPSSFLY